MKTIVALAVVSAALRASCHESHYEPTAPRESANGNESAEHSARASSDGGSPDGDSPRVAPTQVAARHILVMFRGSARAPAEITRTRDAALARAQEARRRALAGEDFGTLAGEYSDEPNAAARGGALPLFHHGEMEPEFERAAFALNVGEISEIVETPFGYHVIQRTQ